MTKASVFTAGRIGIVPVSRAADVLDKSITERVDAFIQDAYLKANPGPQRVTNSQASSAPLAVDLKERMRDYPGGPAAVTLSVSVGTAAPISQAQVLASAERALNQKGLTVTKSGLTQPEIVVQIDALRTNSGRVVFSVAVKYTRLLRWRDQAGRVRIVIGSIHQVEGVGLGPPDFAASDILKGVEMRVGEVVQPHLEANASAR